MECDDLSRRWRGYYLTAYGIAVKHGFKGTEAEWLESLKGEKGDPGTGLDIKGTYPTLLQLETNVPSPAQGDMYNVGTAPPYTIYMWDATGEPGWKSQGQLQGPPGPAGEDGKDGTAIAADGLWGVRVDENGDLILTYVGDDIPPLSINEDGDLIYTLDGNEVNLGHVVGGDGGGGTTDYNLLLNKPSINGIPLQGNLTTEELGIRDGQDGAPGADGATGPEGPPGQAATVEIVETETVEPGTPAAMVELPDSTPQARRYKAQVPQGIQGPAGLGVPPISGPEDAGKVPTVNGDGTGYVLGAGGGTEREWTMLGETDCSVVSGNIVYDGLDNFTEFLVRTETVKNESSSNSGYSFMVNDKELSVVTPEIKSQSLSTERYQWVIAKFNGLVWTVRRSDGAIQENNLSPIYNNANYPYNFVLNVGPATKLELRAPLPQYQAVSGKITVWGR